MAVARYKTEEMGPASSFFQDICPSTDEGREPSVVNYNGKIYFAYSALIMVGVQQARTVIIGSCELNGTNIQKITVPHTFVAGWKKFPKIKIYNNKIHVIYNYKDMAPFVAERLGFSICELDLTGLVNLYVANAFAPSIYMNMHIEGDKFYVLSSSNGAPYQYVYIDRFDMDGTNHTRGAIQTTGSESLSNTELVSHSDGYLYCSWYEYYPLENIKLAKIKMSDLSYTRFNMPTLTPTVGRLYCGKMQIYNDRIYYAIKGRTADLPSVTDIVIASTNMNNLDPQVFILTPHVDIQLEPKFKIINDMIYVMYLEKESSYHQVRYTKLSMDGTQISTEVVTNSNFAKSWLVMSQDDDGITAMWSENNGTGYDWMDELVKMYRRTAPVMVAKWNRINH